MSIIPRDQLVDNLLNQIDELKRRIADLEAGHPGAPGTGAGTLAYFDDDGHLHADMSTEALAVVDAGVTGYVRVYAAK
jgi:hypothetical protein